MRWWPWEQQSRWVVEGVFFPSWGCLQRLLRLSCVGRGFETFVHSTSRPLSWAQHTTAAAECLTHVEL